MDKASEGESLPQYENVCSRYCKEYIWDFDNLGDKSGLVYKWSSRYHVSCKSSDIYLKVGQSQLDKYFRKCAAEFREHLGKRPVKRRS